MSIFHFLSSRRFSIWQDGIEFSRITMQDWFILNETKTNIIRFWWVWSFFFFWTKSNKLSLPIFCVCVVRRYSKITHEAHWKTFWVIRFTFFFFHFLFVPIYRKCLLVLYSRKCLILVDGFVCMLTEVYTKFEFTFN